MKLSKLGISGLISLLFYTVRVVFNAVLGMYLFVEKLESDNAQKGRKND